jgi:uncharacterized protein
MKRRTFLRSAVVLGSFTALSRSHAQSKSTEIRGAAIIDSHCHAGKGMNFDKPNADPWTTYNDPQWTLDRMAEVGIDQTVIFPISNNTYREGNEEIASYVRRWPSKFIGFAKHDGKTEAGQIAGLLKHEVHDLGLRGLKLHGVPTPEMVDTAAELRIPILYHPPSVSESLEAVESNPKVSFILAHLGNFASHDWHEHVRAIQAAKRLPNLYLDTSSVVFVPFLEQAARELPTEKLVFGSDGPLLDCRIELAKVRLLKLPPEQEALVLGGNIRRLLEQS